MPCVAPGDPPLPGCIPQGWGQRQPANSYRDKGTRDTERVKRPKSAQLKCKEHPKGLGLLGGWASRAAPAVYLSLVTRCLCHAATARRHPVKPPEDRQGSPGSVLPSSDFEGFLSSQTPSERSMGIDECSILT